VNNRWWLILERAQATLAAAGLAGFTWWLVQSSPRDSGPARAATASSAPDYTLAKARVARIDPAGHLEAILDGQSMRHYPDTDRLLIDDLVLSARDKNGQGLHAVAAQGEADRQADVVTLRGGAHVVGLPNAAADAGTGLRSGPINFVGEGLRVDTRSRVLTSDHPVDLTQDQTHVHGQTLRYDDSTGVTEMGGRVVGRYDAPAAP
jgi:lipopolysaccharide export system protein LptC